MSLARLRTLGKKWVLTWGGAIGYTAAVDTALPRAQVDRQAPAVAVMIELASPAAVNEPPVPALAG